MGERAPPQALPSLNLVELGEDTDQLSLQRVDLRRQHTDAVVQLALAALPDTNRISDHTNDPTNVDPTNVDPTSDRVTSHSGLRRGRDADVGREVGVHAATISNTSSVMQVVSRISCSRRSPTDFRAHSAHSAYARHTARQYRRAHSAELFRFCADGERTFPASGWALVHEGRAVN